MANSKYFICPTFFKFISWMTLVFIGFAQCLSANTGITPPETPEIPDSLVKIGDHSGYALVVEKKSQRMFVYDHKYNIVKTYSVTTGKHQGDKKIAGDKKTPEGIYFFSLIKEKKYLAPRYGIMALTMNYPNVMDDHKRKKGNGIWLHATDQPQRAFRQFDTLGCVVVVNKDMFEVSKYVSLENTPIIIEEELSFAEKEVLDKQTAEVTDFVNTWKSAWEEKNIDKYIESYSKIFFHDGMNKEEWRRYKRILNDRYQSISIDISDLKIFRHHDYTVASFLQNYRSDGFQSKGIKRLYLVNEENSWKVMGEEWKPVRKKVPWLVAQKYRYLIPEKNTDKMVKRENWLLSQNPSHYALQLLGVSSEHKMIRFIEQYGLFEDAGYYKTSLNGKDWYVLIYGDYPNLTEANGAKMALPDYLKLPSPWVRSLKSVQLAINQFSGFNNK